MMHTQRSILKSCALRPFHTNRRGVAAFTLIELAAVLLILSLVLGAGLTFLTGRAIQEKYNITEKRLDQIEIALWQYRRVYARLPCPADRTLAPSDLKYGIGPSGTGGTCPTPNYAGANISMGAIPTRTLNLPDSVMLDGWDRKFTYAVSNNLAQANGFGTAPADPTKIPIANVPGGLVQIHSATASPYLIANSKTNPYGAAFVLLSHGRNGFCAYSKYGKKNLAAQTDNAGERQNARCANNGASYSAPADDAFIQTDQNLDTTNNNNNYFDDIVRYKTRFQLYAGTATPENPPITSFPLNP